MPVPSRGLAFPGIVVGSDDEEGDGMPAMESVLQGDPEVGEALVALMSERDGLREFGARVLALAANSLMSAEADAMCGASLGERGDARVNSRNGCRPRSLKVSVGDLELEIPKLRHGTCYPGPILERWGRVDASLAALVVEAHANGASTRDMSLLAQSLGASAMSSSEASRLAASLDAQVAELRSRDLGDRRRCCLWVGATYARCRVEGRSVLQAAVTAIALDEDGRKRLVGPDCVDAEPCDDGLASLAPVKARGLSCLVPCASDDHRGLVRALSEAFQGVAWQRRTAHLQRSLSRAARRRAGEALARELAKAAFAQADALFARAVCPLACEAMGEAGEDAAAELMEGAREGAQQHLSLPREHWRYVRANDAQERANREVKRRYRSVQSFPSRASLVRLVGAVMLEEEGAWGHHRVLSPESAARAWERPEPPAPDGSLARAIAEAEQRAREIVGSMVDRHAAKG